MECNRDEAMRAKEIADKKFEAKDISGAKKFALKAQALYPALDGIAQLIATFDVHIAAEQLVNGEKDWYAILDVNSAADDELVKKQYRKLALLLHPDKNKSVGAEAAFKLISEAWSVLSDKSRRMAFDAKRTVKVNQQKPPHPHTSANGVHRSTKTAPTNLRAQKSTARAAPSGFPPAYQPRATPPSQQEKPTFWTTCNSCKMQYEYLRIYLNNNLLCPNCRKPFLAVETGVPTTTRSPSVPFFSKQQFQQQKPPLQQQQQQQQKTLDPNRNVYGQVKTSNSFPARESYGFQRGSNVDSFKNTCLQSNVLKNTMPGSASTSFSDPAAAAARLVQERFEKAKRELEEARDKLMRGQMPSSKGTATGFPSGPSTHVNVGANASGHGQVFQSKVEKHFKKRKSVGSSDIAGDSANGFQKSNTVAYGFDTFKVQKMNSFAGDPGRANTSFRVYRSRPDFTLPDIHNMLLQRGLCIVKKKLDDWNAAAAAKAAEEEKAKQKQRQKQINKENGAVFNENLVSNTGKSDCPDGISSEKKVASGISIDGSDKEDEEPGSMDVPDPDFHDFDKDRAESSFEPEQIWATYDDEDGMPRYYALIQKVLSVQPFKIRMSFLNSRTNSEFSSLNWVGMGFPKTCGDFRVGKIETSDRINIFSHKVKYEKGLRGSIKIIPQKGDIWALYRNWSSDWNEHTPDDVVYKYDMVEALSDYDEEKGVSVAPLVKAAGFKTVFCRHRDTAEVRRIPKEEMFRFSHQVPSHLLTGEEAPNAPKGFHELDPAATPIELLQVITEPNEEIKLSC